jgi:hypothetical protein
MGCFWINGENKFVTCSGPCGFLTLMRGMTAILVQQERSVRVSIFACKIVDLCLYFLVQKCELNNVHTKYCCMNIIQNASLVSRTSAPLRNTNRVEHALCYKSRCIQLWVLAIIIMMWLSWRYKLFLLCYFVNSRFGR